MKYFKEEAQSIMPDEFKTLDDVTLVLKQCSQHRDGSSILLCLLLGVCVGDLEKNPENPARSEKN